MLKARLVQLTKTQSWTPASLEKIHVESEEVTTQHFFLFTLTLLDTEWKRTHLTFQNKLYAVLSDLSKNKNWHYLQEWHDLGKRTHQINIKTWDRSLLGRQEMKRRNNALILKNKKGKINFLQGIWKLLQCYNDILKMSDSSILLEG